MYEIMFTKSYTQICGLCWQELGVFSLAMLVPNKEGFGVAFFATGPGLGLIMYILTTLEFPTHTFNFHLLTTSVNAKYYYY